MLSKDKLLYRHTAVQIAEHCNVTRDTVYKWIKQGYIPRNYIETVHTYTGIDYCLLDTYLYNLMAEYGELI